MFESKLGAFRDVPNVICIIVVISFVFENFKNHSHSFFPKASLNAQAHQQCVMLEQSRMIDVVFIHFIDKRNMAGDATLNKKKGSGFMLLFS